MGDTKGSTVAERVKDARLQTAVRQRKTVSQERMAELVSAALGRPLAQAQWSRYETGETEPPLDVILAIALVSGLSPAYIAFGDDAPPTPPDAVQVHKLKEEEVERAKRRAESEQRAKPMRSKPRKGRGKAG